MNEKENVGIYQLDNGFWGFRYTITVNGKKKDFKKTKDLKGNPNFKVNEGDIFREI